MLAVIAAFSMALSVQPGLHLWFEASLHCRALDTDPRVPELKKKVESFAGGFQMPGFDVKSIDHKVGQANGFANGHHPEIQTDGQDHSNPVLNPVPC